MFIIPALALLGIQFLAFYLARGLDYYGKQLNYEKVIRGKINIFFVHSKYEEKNFLPSTNRPVSRVSFVFQIANYVYVVAYVVMTVLFVLQYSSILGDIVVISAFLYFGACFFDNLVVSGLSSNFSNRKK